MSAAGQAYAKQAGKIAEKFGGGRKPDRARDDELPPGEAKALAILRKEAKAEGSKLATGGKGGLPPSLVLNVMRRANYRCEYDGFPGEAKKARCNELGTEANGGITVHHKGGIPATAALSNAGHTTTPKNLATLCGMHHTLLHEKARDKGVDSSQVLPAGDEGTDRDRGGKPPAPATA